MSTTWERFRAAALVLAGGGPVKQRLVEAYQGCLEGIDLEELPREVRPAFQSVEAALHSCRRTGALNAVAASALKMSEPEAARHSQALVGVFAALHELHPAHPAQRVSLLRAVADDEDSPARLNRA